MPDSSLPRYLKLIFGLGLPAGCQIKGIAAHGASSWTRTARIDTTLNGEKQSFFIKVSTRETILHLPWA